MNLKLFPKSAFSAVLISVVVSFSANAATCSGVTMPDKLNSDNVEFVLNGMGVRLQKLLAFQIKVYVATLYLSKQSNDPEYIIEQDQPRYVAMYFLRDLDRGTIRKAMEESFRRNAGEKVAQMKNEIDSFQKSLTGVKKGQTLALSYIPGQGTTVILDGKVKAQIEGADFASALISLWLGKPPNREIKVGMLGGQC